MTRMLHLPITLALLTLAAAAPHAQADQTSSVVNAVATGDGDSAFADEDEVEDKKKDKIKYATEWPAPKDKEQLKVDVARLRKARTEGMETQAHAGLVGEGAACAPALIFALGKEKGEDARDRIITVLELVTSAEHTRLLSAHFKDKSIEVRVWCLRRVSLFPDTGVREAAVAALTHVEKSKKPDDRELYAAALCCTSTGDLSGLDRVAKRAEAKWKKYGMEIRAALEAVRSKEATAHFAPLLKSEKRKTVVAGLNLLAGAGDTESATPLVAPFLDDTDNTLRVAAINALRGIVDGELPLDKLPVFKAIELANDWKKRV